MKGKYINILIVALVTIVSLSCEKSLDLSPKDQISDASFWKNPDQFELAANDFYFNLQGAHNYADNNSDIAFGSGSNSVSNGSYLAEANSPIWNNAYSTIRATNYLLTKAEESNLGDLVERYVGEALFFRAYSYWKLTKNFGGVPIIKKVLDVSSEELFSERQSQQQVVDFILEDLDAAVDKLPIQSDLSSEEMGRVTKGAALALKARVALYQGTWMKYHESSNGEPYLSNTVSAAQTIIESGEYELYNEKAENSYKYLFIDEGDDSKEVILARRYYKNRATHNWTRELWFNAMIPTKNLADQYLSADGLPIDKSPLFQGYGSMVSEYINRDPRMSMTFIIPGTETFNDNGGWSVVYPGFAGTNATRSGYMLRKFLGESLDAAQFQASYDFKEFRYAEVLLNLAEALYERDGSISDLDLEKTINLVRERVNMPDLTNGFISSNNLNMRNEIRRERCVELAFEGYRREDLRRWKIAETIMPNAIKGVKFIGTEFQTRYPNINIGTDIKVDEAGFIVVEAAAARQFLPRHYLNPIPLQQVQLSKGTLQQNPGW